VREHPNDVPTYDPETTVLLYPTDTATSLGEGKVDLSKLKTLVVVESTWQKAAGVARHPKIRDLPTVKIEAKEGTFWRYQELGTGFLSTLEATYHFMVEHWNARNGVAAVHDDDDDALRESKRPSKRAKPSAVATAVQAQLSPKSTDAACGRESITITRDDQSLSSQPFPKEQQQKQAPVLAYPGCYDDMMLIYAQMHSRAAGHGGSESRLMPRHWTAATMIDEKEL